MYGVGDGSPDNSNLVDSIRGLAAADRGGRAALGEFGRKVIQSHFALDTVSAGFAEFCAFAIANQPRRYVAAADGLRTAYVWARERRWYC
jgi:hypothetical protein